MTLVFTEPVTIDRTAPGAYVDGTFVPGAVTPISIDADIQGATDDPDGRAVLNTPEAQRTTEELIVLTDVPLLVADETAAQSADTFAHQGHTYEVQETQRWQHIPETAHYRSVARKVDRS